MVVASDALNPLICNPVHASHRHHCNLHLLIEFAWASCGDNPHIIYGEIIDTLRSLLWVVPQEEDSFEAVRPAGDLVVGNSVRSFAGNVYNPMKIGEDPPISCKEIY